MNSKSIILVLSSLAAGGAEKVMALIANQAAHSLQVTLILLSKKERHYIINDRVEILEPYFTIEEMPRWLFTIRVFWWLRVELAKLSTQSVLSFSGKYNAFVLLASWGLGKMVFVSDRSRPGISYGKFLDFLNPLVYRRAAGIVAQTQAAKQFSFGQTKHRNIKVIPNPIVIPETISLKRKQLVVLNVGRFISSKQQELLVDYFNACRRIEWELVFLGDGHRLEYVKKIVKSSDYQESIRFLGNVGNVGAWYERSAIFAFTSTSEGFPNSLAEAMSHGCACISYDCTAGPADIIDDGINGFLIPEGDHEMYKEKLSLLMEDEELRIRFGKAACEKMKAFDAYKITQRYLDFILS